MRGFFGVGIYHPKKEVNVGGLWRSAFIYGASFVFTIGRRYERQAADTPRTPLTVPLFHFSSWAAFRESSPYSAPLVGVELDDRATLLGEYEHPERAVYLLGAEDGGLPKSVLDQCHDVVQVPTLMSVSLNVASAGSVVLYDRHVKEVAA